MSASAIIRELLANHAPLTAIVAPAKIRVGNIPQDLTKQLPAIGVRPVSSNENWTTARNLKNKMIRERVQVTVFANDFITMERALKAASLGRGVHTGVVKGFRVCSILPESTNPYFGPADDNIHEQSRDFMVTFIEAN